MIFFGFEPQKMQIPPRQKIFKMVLRNLTWREKNHTFENLTRQKFKKKGEGSTDATKKSSAKKKEGHFKPF